MVGMGTLGSWVLKHLTGSALGELALVDFDSVEPSNISRQGLFTMGDIGKKKIDVAATFVETFGTSTNVRRFDRKLDSQSCVADILDDNDGADIVILTADKPRWQLALWFQRECYRRAIPLVRANQLGAGPLVVPGLPHGCVMCELLAISSRLSMSVDEILSESLIPSFASGTLSTIPAITSAILAHDVVRYLIDVLPTSLLSVRISIKPDPIWSLEKTYIPRHNNCPVCSI
jgi:molybdopterin/thiamine biosynthesis adenylyltransferase